MAEHKRTAYQAFNGPNDDAELEREYWLLKWGIVDEDFEEDQIIAAEMKEESPQQQQQQQQQEEEDDEEEEEGEHSATIGTTTKVEGQTLPQEEHDATTRVKPKQIRHGKRNRNPNPGNIARLEKWKLKRRIEKVEKKEAKNAPPPQAPIVPTGLPGRPKGTRNTIKPAPQKTEAVIQILAIMRTSGKWLAEGKQASAGKLWDMMERIFGECEEASNEIRDVSLWEAVKSTIQKLPSPGTQSQEPTSKTLGKCLKELPSGSILKLIALEIDGISTTKPFWREMAALRPDLNIQLHVKTRGSDSVARYDLDKLIAFWKGILCDNVSKYAALTDAWAAATQQREDQAEPSKNFAAGASTRGRNQI